LDTRLLIGFAEIDGDSFVAVEIGGSFGEFDLLLFLVSLEISDESQSPLSMHFS
jgi:hypothetical protein